MVQTLRSISYEEEVRANMNFLITGAIYTETCFERSTSVTDQENQLKLLLRERGEMVMFAT